MAKIKSKFPGVTISIKGAKGSGKSTLAHEITVFLKTRGYNLSSMDDGRPVDFGSGYHQSSPDDRQIVVETKEKQKRSSAGLEKR